MSRITYCGYFFLLLQLPLQLFSINVSVTTLGYLQEKPYLEIYSRVIGNSVQFAATEEADSLNYASIEMLILLKQEEKLVVADKFNISSPSSLSVIDFWDMRRYTLDNGEYELEIKYVDLNNISDTTSYKESILVNHSEHYVSNSDILIMKDVSSEKSEYPFTRSGFYYEPAPFNLFGESDSLFLFYVELYNPAEIEQGLFYRYSVRQADNSEEVLKPAYKQIKSVNDLQILQKFDVAEIPSGNYELNLELINKEKQVLHQVTERFSVYHPSIDFRNAAKGDAKYETSFVHMLDEGEINYSLKAIFPRVTNNMTHMLNSILWGEEIEPKKYYLYSFWSNFSVENAKSVYDKYMNVARAVDLEYASNVGHGFESDRGYFFLKYGKPDDVVSVEDEPSAPPYEIWIYNYLEETKQTAVKFLFYNPSIVANDYILLHSTCRGEISNPRWELELYKDDNIDNTSNLLDNTEVQDGLNRNARRYFTDY